MCSIISSDKRGLVGPRCHMDAKRTRFFEKLASLVVNRVRDEDSVYRRSWARHLAEDQER